MASSRPSAQGVFWRLAAYGLAGWCLEIAVTGVANGLDGRDRRLRGETYLWMLPVYGAGGLLLEQAQRILGTRVPRPARAAVYTLLIYAVEYGSGSLLRRMVGNCPWDYGARGVNVNGLIRLDFAPLWYACALAFEPVREHIDRVVVSVDR